MSDTNDIEDMEIRALFEEGQQAGFMRFHHMEKTTLGTYYFFQYQHRGSWQDTMMTGREIHSALNAGLKP